MGYRYVDEAISDPLVRSFVQHYMNEITSTLPDVPGVDIPMYKTTLIERFSNAAVRDQVQRLAEDGSKKIRNFIIPPLEEKVQSSESIRYIAFALAAWIRYLRGNDEQGQPIHIVDPMSTILRERVSLQPHDPTAILALEQVFGERVPANQQVAFAIKASLDAIDSLGTRQACEQILQH
jgi:mannitol 2-dehydrogenase